MKRPILVLLLTAMAALAGCTPFSEDVAKKASAAGDPSNVTQVSSPADVSAPLVDPSTGRIIRNYGPTIKRYAERYGFDWRLVLAVMKQESRFVHHAESHKGATGLMQIMPVTEEEVARKLELDDLSHPENNIRGGIFYLKQLYASFDAANEADRLKLTLAAYNAGVSRVSDAQEVAGYLHENATEWQSVKDALPLLSKRFQTLHRQVWQQDRPKSGWFGNAKQTIAYVESVLGYYDEYRMDLN